jgi:hypothetical protein
MDQKYDEINVFGTVCQRGQSVEIAFDRSLQFAPYDDVAAFVLEVRLERDGSVSLWQSASSEEGLVFQAIGTGRPKVQPIPIRSGEQIQLTRILGVRSGKIYHPSYPGCYIFMAGTLYLGGCLSLDFAWRSATDVTAEESALRLELLRPRHGRASFETALLSVCVLAVDACKTLIGRLGCKGR